MKELKTPEDLVHYESLICASMRKALVMDEDMIRGEVPSMGYTHSSGSPDIPSDAEWVKSIFDEGRSPYDGPCFWLQVNLEDIPGYARNDPAVPSVGCLWVFIDLSGDRCEATVHFDPRRADDIPWLPRNEKTRAQKPSFHSVSIPAEVIDAIEQTDELLSCTYSDHYFQMVPKGKPYFGGYAWEIQGDGERSKNTIFCTMNDQPFLDSGALYVHYEKNRGWWAEIQSY